MIKSVGKTKGFSSALWLFLTILGLSSGADAQRPKTDAVSAQSKPRGTLEPTYRVEYDRKHKLTPSRMVFVQLDEKAFDLCSLRFVFTLIKRDYPASYLTVYAFSDKATLDAFAKFKEREANSGSLNVEDSPAGHEALKRWYLDMGFPKEFRGFRANFVLNDQVDSVEQYIDYMPNKGESNFVRAEF